METVSDYPTHHHTTEKGQDYVLFQVKCETCGVLLFEFVHKQGWLVQETRIMAIPDPNPPMGAKSWYKPMVRIICKGSSLRHSFAPALEGENRNQVCTSRGMTEDEFEEWYKI